MMFIGIADAGISSASHQIRLLYAIIISTCFPSSPYNLWNKYKDSMTEDILHRVRSITATYDLIYLFYDTAIIAKTQEELQDMVNRFVDTGRKYGMEINIEKSHESIQE